VAQAPVAYALEYVETKAWNSCGLSFLMKMKLPTYGWRGGMSRIALQGRKKVAHKRHVDKQVVTTIRYERVVSWG